MSKRSLFQRLELCWRKELKVFSPLPVWQKTRRLSCGANTTWVTKEAPSFTCCWAVCPTGSRKTWQKSTRWLTTGPSTFLKRLFSCSLTGGSISRVTKSLKSISHVIKHTCHCFHLLWLNATVALVRFIACHCFMCWDKSSKMDQEVASCDFFYMEYSWNDFTFGFEISVASDLFTDGNWSCDSNISMNDWPSTTVLDG